MNFLTKLTLLALLTITTTQAYDGGQAPCEDISKLIQLKKEVGFKLIGIAERNIGIIAKDAHYFLAMNTAEVEYLVEGYNACINGIDPMLSISGLDTLDRADILEEEETRQLHSK